MRKTYIKKLINLPRLIASVCAEVDIANELARLCKSRDERVKMEALRLVLAYGYGRPKEQVEMSGTFDVHAVVAAARERVIRARTIPPSSVPKLIEGEAGAATSDNLSTKEVASNEAEAKIPDAS